MSNLILPDGKEHDKKVYRQMHAAQQAAIAQEMAMARASRLTALAQAYLEDTGLKPQEVKLVERHLNLKGQFVIEWTFEKINPEGVLQTHPETTMQEMPCPGTPREPETKTDAGS